MAKKALNLLAVCITSFILPLIAQADEPNGNTDIQIVNESNAIAHLREQTAPITNGDHALNPGYNAYLPLIGDPTLYNWIQILDDYGDKICEIDFIADEQEKVIKHSVVNSTLPGKQNPFHCSVVQKNSRINPTIYITNPQ